MQTIEKDPTVATDSKLAEEVDDFLRSQGEVGPPSPECAERPLSLDETIKSSRTPEQQGAIEAMLSNFEAKVEQMGAIKAETDGIDLVSISDPRLKEAASLLQEIDLADERVEIAKTQDSSTYNELVLRRDELNTMQSAALKRLEVLYGSEPSPPSRQDLPNNASLLQKIRYTFSKGYRNSLNSDIRASYDHQVAEQQAEQSSTKVECAEINSKLSSGAYRSNERAVYQELRQNIDSIILFNATELAKIAEEAKAEADPAKRIRLQAELLVVTKEISQIREKITKAEDRFDSSVKNGYGWVASIEVPGVGTLFGDDIGSRGVYGLEVSALTRRSLTTQAAGIVSEFANKLFGRHHQEFKAVHDKGNSEFATRRLYASSGEVRDIDNLANLMEGPLTRPSEMLDSLLTDDELDRISLALTSMGGSSSDYSMNKDSPVDALKAIIERQKQIKGFLERLKLDSTVTHATSANNALLILQDGHLRSEVGAKSNNQHGVELEIANSTQGDVIDNRTISFSIDGVEDQFLETYNPRGDKIDERQGVVFARRTSEICQDSPWFLMVNTQTGSDGESLELQVIDEGGIAVEDLDMFVDQADFGYWTGQLQQIGYDALWIKEHIHSLDFKRDKQRQISEIMVDNPKPNEGLPQNAGTYKDVRRVFYPRVLGDRTISVDPSAPELVFPTKIFRF